MKRVDVQWNWWPINRPYVLICDPDDDGTIWVGLSWGNRNSDPVWNLSVLLGGAVARPFVALADRRWDRAVAERDARIKARS